MFLFITFYFLLRTPASHYLIFFFLPRVFLFLIFFDQAFFQRKVERGLLLPLSRPPRRYASYFLARRHVARHCLRPARSCLTSEWVVACVHAHSLDVRVKLAQSLHRKIG